MNIELALFGAVIIVFVLILIFITWVFLELGYKVEIIDRKYKIISFASGIILIIISLFV